MITVTDTDVTRTPSKGETTITKPGSGSTPKTDYSSMGHKWLPEATVSKDCRSLPSEWSYTRGDDRSEPDVVVSRSRRMKQGSHSPSRSIPPIPSTNIPPIPA